MNFPRLIPLGLGIALILANSSKGQSFDLEAHTSSGYAIGNSFVSWTIGEPIIETTFGVLVFSQGFQQPNFGPLVNQSNSNSNQEFILFPNPVERRLILKKIIPDGKTFKCRVLDIHGRILDLKNWDSNSQEIGFDFFEYSPGIYLVQLSNESSGEKYHFKVIKNETN